MKQLSKETLELIEKGGYEIKKMPTNSRTVTFYNNYYVLLKNQKIGKSCF